MDGFQKLCLEIEAEMARGEKQWGTVFDDKNTLNDWLTYVNIYLSKAALMSATQTEQETNLRKALGLLFKLALRVRIGTVAPRHYEGQVRPASLPEVK